ncbi:MAG: hypothetical protein Kow0080_34150 [Candidatus Promineifilaceae bacterium]
MKKTESNPNFGRRRFLKGAVLTTAAAVATGAGAALLKNSAATITAVSTQTPATLIATSPPSTIPSNTEPLAQIAALHAENTRLQSALESAQAQLAALEAGSQTTTLETENLRMELTNANERLSALGGLLALYEELENVSLEEVVAEGVTAVSEELASLLDQIPTFQEGVAVSRAALEAFEEKIPLLENGRVWLAVQTTKMETFMANIEQFVQDAAEKAGPFIEMFVEWVEKVLRWLPFGLGEKSANILNAIVALLTETPATLSGLQVNVSEPIALLLGPTDQPEASVRTQMVEPVREKVLAKAEKVITLSQNVDAAYREKVASPTETAVARRQAIQQMITAYRQQHQI